METTRETLQHKFGLKIEGKSVLLPMQYERPVCISSNVKCYGVRMGAFSYIAHDSAVWNAQIGRYCSIGDGVTLGASRHPHTWMTTALFPYASYNYFRTMTSSGSLETEPDVPQSFEGQPSHTVIGNDVWIGQNCLVPSYHPTQIGTGAVLAGHAVVTKDVPPYAVAAGNPARVVKQRFTDEVCADLMQSCWWNYDWTAFAAAQPDLWMNAPYADPVRFVAWWRDEGFDVLKNFPIAEQDYIVQFEGEKMRISEVDKD